MQWKCYENLMPELAEFIQIKNDSDKDLKKSEIYYMKALGKM